MVVIIVMIIGASPFLLFGFGFDCVRDDDADTRNATCIARLSIPLLTLLLLLRLVLRLMYCLQFCHKTQTKDTKTTYHQWNTKNTTCRSIFQSIGFCCYSHHSYCYHCYYCWPAIKRKNEQTKKSKKRKNWFKHENITKQCGARIIKMLYTNWHLYVFG